MLGGEGIDFHTLYYSPYRVQSDDDNEAPITKKHLKEFNDKLDKLMASSSSQGPYSEASIQGMVATFVKEHEPSISKATSAIDTSTKVCIEMTTKVEKLNVDANLLLDSLQAAAQKNAATVNWIVDKLASTLQAEKEHFASFLQTFKQAMPTFSPPLILA